MTIDITKNEYMISHFQHTLKSSLSTKKISHTQGRMWDGFCYILSGRCRYVFSDGNEFTATKGSILYLAKDALYDMFVDEGPYDGIYFDFLFDAPLPRKSALFFSKDSTEIERLFLRMYRRFSIKSTGYRSDCISDLYRIYAAIQMLNAPQYLPSTSRHKMEQARQFILEHYADDTLSVHALASMAKVSEVHFRKLFEATYSTTPIAYIVATRLNRAKELMLSSDLNLEEIALQCGFSSLSYFCRVFKQQTALTPHQYRMNRIESISPQNEFFLV